MRSNKFIVCTLNITLRDEVKEYGINYIRSQLDLEMWKENLEDPEKLDGYKYSDFDGVSFSDKNPLEIRFLLK
jgi:hypothetical protein